MSSFIPLTYSSSQDVMYVIYHSESEEEKMVQYFLKSYYEKSLDKILDRHINNAFYEYKFNHSNVLKNINKLDKTIDTYVRYELEKIYNILGYSQIYIETYLDKEKIGIFEYFIIKVKIRIDDKEFWKEIRDI